MWSNSALLLSPLWPLYLLTSDPVPWLCPVAGLTLALQPAVSPGLSAAGEKPSEKRFIPPQKSHQHIFSWFQTCCCTAPLIHCTAEDGVINLNDIAKRSCSISQMFFFLSSLPRWRTGQGHFSAWKDWKHEQTDTCGLSVKVDRLSLKAPCNIMCWHLMALDF